MKKIIAVLIFAFSIGAGFAQVQRTVTKKSSADTGAYAKKDKQSMKKDMKALNLTKEQRGQLKSMKQENKAAKENIENDATLTEQQKKEKIKNMRRQNADKMKSILTEEQRGKLKEMRRNKRA